MSLSKEHTRHNLQAWAKCQLPGWGWHATWPGLLYPALQNRGCLSSPSQSPQGSRTLGFHVRTFVNAFQNFGKLQQGYGGLFYTSGSSMFPVICRHFPSLLSSDMRFWHQAYWVPAMSSRFIVELHRKTGQEFPLPEQFQSLECDGTLESAVFPLYTLSNFPLRTYMCIELTNIHINVCS